GGVHMARACGPDVAPALNPGASLGPVMGKLGRSGRDKVTLIASPTVRAFGLWAEQLLAESTGKEGKGLIPIAGEPMAPPACYGNDRLFVHLRLDGDANADGDRHLRALERAGQPVLRLTLHDRYDVAAQFFCWEFATAVASHVLGSIPLISPTCRRVKRTRAGFSKKCRSRGGWLACNRTASSLTFWLRRPPAGISRSWPICVRPCRPMRRSARSARRCWPGPALPRRQGTGPDIFTLPVNFTRVGRRR